MTRTAIYPDLDGQTVLVTGGGSGIGASIVEHFAEQGASVGFIDVAETPSKTLVEEIAAKGHKRPHFVAADLCDIKALRAAIDDIRDALGPITILVNNAAHDQRHSIDEV
ncbi:Putative oxidoreductase in arabinose utilization cluster, partial [hydrothermal vent metagenome]